MITLSAFRGVPPFARGLVRDLRVRWALEEAGIPYQERLIGPRTRRPTRTAPCNPSGRSRLSRRKI